MGSVPRSMCCYPEYLILISLSGIYSGVVS